MEFKDRLKKLRQERGISQQALADAIFVSRSAVAKWENGLGVPSGESMEALVKFFGVPLKEIETEQAEQIIVEKNHQIRRLSTVLSCIAFVMIIALAAVFSVLIVEFDFSLTPEGAAGSYAQYPYIENNDYIIYYKPEFEGTEYACIGNFRAVHKALIGYYVDPGDYEIDALIANNQYVGSIYTLKGRDRYYYIIRRNTNLVPVYMLDLDEIVALGNTCRVEANSYFATDNPIPGFWIGDNSIMVG